MSDPLKLLLIEDHPALIETLTDFFEDAGLALDAAESGAEGIRKACENSYDVIILDLGLPDLDGIDVCKSLRLRHRIRTPLLMLTARDTLADKLEGFEAGAHDYLCKPFAPEELEARVRTLARYHPRPRRHNLQRAGVILNPGTREVLRDQRTLSLSPTGFRLLEILMRDSPEFKSKEELEREIWGDFPPGSDSLRTHLAQLRKQLDKPFKGPDLIETRYGVGVRFRGEAHAD